MNRKFIFIIIPLVALVLIGGGIVAWVLLSGNGATSGDTSNGTLRNINTNAGTGTNTGTAGNTNAAPTNATTSAPVLSDPTSTKEAVALARSFTERFGTYSNQNDFDNINNLRVYMTDKMEKAADKIIADSEGNQTSYYGITTRVLATDISKEEEKRVEVTLTTQRQESSDEKPEPNIFQQDVELVLVLEGNGWLVDSVNWK